MNNGAPFVSGLIVAGYLIVGLFFLRFWKQLGDRLFGFFATAFLLLALQRSLLTLLRPDHDMVIVLYSLRAFAFLLIVYGIIDKNRKGG